MIDEQLLRSIIRIQCKQNDIPADVHRYVNMDSDELQEMLYLPYRYRQVCEASKATSQVWERNQDPIRIDYLHGSAEESYDIVQMEFVFGGQHLLTGNKDGSLILWDLRHRKNVHRSLSLY